MELNQREQNEEYMCEGYKEKKISPVIFFLYKNVAVKNFLVVEIASRVFKKPCENVFSFEKQREVQWY